MMDEPKTNLYMTIKRLRKDVSTAVVQKEIVAKANEDRLERAQKNAYAAQSVPKKRKRLQKQKKSVLLEEIISSVLSRSAPSIPDPPAELFDDDEDSGWGPFSASYIRNPHVEPSDGVEYFGYKIFQQGENKSLGY
jgi:hypothetical protein